MQPLIDNARRFGQRPEEFAAHAAGQSPAVLFVTCSDSGVVPALIAGARPGQLFELRTAGAAPDGAPGRPEDPAVPDVIHGHVLAQLLRLRSYPCVERRPADGRLHLRGWYYEVHTGAVLEYRSGADAFEAL